MSDLDYMRSLLTQNDIVFIEEAYHNEDDGTTGIGLELVDHAIVNIYHAFTGELWDVVSLLDEEDFEDDDDNDNYKSDELDATSECGCYICKGQRP